MYELPPLPMPKRPDPKRQLQGLRSRAIGKAFEDRIDKTLEYYAARGFAQIDKTPEPMKILRRMDKGRFVACFLKKAQPDYKGTIKGGRSILFDAKYTEADRMHQDVVSEDQWKYLDRGAALGARCYVLIGFRSGKVYRVPWSACADMKRIFGHQYVTEAEIKQYDVQVSWTGLLMILD